MAGQKGNKRSKKAAKRKSKLTRRSAQRAKETPAHHWDTLFGAGVRFAARYMEGSPDNDVVRFFARGRLPNQTWVLGSFVEAAQLSANDAAVVRGWTALQPSLYECLENRGTVLEVRDLTTWQAHTVKVVHAEAARAFESVRFAAMILLPTPDGPVLGGEVRGTLPSVLRQDALRVAANLCRAYPRLCQRAHPAILKQMLANEGRAFREHFGASFQYAPAGEIVNLIRGFTAANKPEEVEGFMPVANFNLDANEEEVGLLHDEGYGFVLQGGLRDFLEGVEKGNVLTVEGWLKDGSVSPALFDLAHRLFPASLNGALTEVLGEPTHWAEQRRTLIERYKPRYRRPIPHLFPMPIQVSRAFDPRGTTDGIGMNALLGLER